MNKIIRKIQYSEKVYRFDVEAPLIAKSRKAGNFVIIRVDANSERMPLTIADADIEKGTITLVVQKVGLSSTKLCNLNEGDEIHDVVGPFGQPYPHRELRNCTLRRRRCGRSSYAAYHQSPESCRQPGSLGDSRTKQGPCHHGR